LLSGFLLLLPLSFCLSLYLLQSPSCSSSSSSFVLCFWFFLVLGVVDLVWCLVSWPISLVFPGSLCFS
jgi:hypothetical protein